MSKHDPKVTLRQITDYALRAQELCAQNELPANATYGGCLTDCQLGPYCGDNIVQRPYEECDLGASNGGSDVECSASCIRQVLVQ